MKDAHVLIFYWSDSRSLQTQTQREAHSESEVIHDAPSEIVPHNRTFHLLIWIKTTGFDEVYNGCMVHCHQGFFVSSLVFIATLQEPNSTPRLPLGCCCSWTAVSFECRTNLKDCPSLWDALIKISCVELAESLQNVGLGPVGGIIRSGKLFRTVQVHAAESFYQSNHRSFPTTLTYWPPL